MQQRVMIVVDVPEDEAEALRKAIYPLLDLDV